MDNNQQGPTNAYPDMRKKPNKAAYSTANNRDKVVPRDLAKTHPASMKPTIRPKGA